jgi:AraC-like DNA-binding protein
VIPDCAAARTPSTFLAMMLLHWLEEIVMLPALERWLPSSLVASSEAAPEPPARFAIIEEAKVRIEEELDSIRIGELSEDSALSRTEFSRVFRRFEGMSPREYLQERKVQRARQLLEGARTLSEIALELGFYDQSHFTRVFKQLTGETPAAYRKRRTNVQDDETASG